MEEIPEEDREAAATFGRYLELEEMAATATIAALYVAFPSWMQPTTIVRVQHAVETLLAAGQSPEQISALVALARQGEWEVPGSAPEPVAFFQNVSYLAHVQSALSLPADEATRELGETSESAGLRSTQANAAKAGSAPRHVERNRRILAAHKAGKAPKQIADDEQLTASTVRRILKHAEDE